jgi:pimeloyl-ACP methyl ester carboxylesterase
MLGFSERGSGPPLVLVHAFPLDSTMWRAQVEWFSPRYRVVTPDVIGFGSSQPYSRPWSMSDMGDELEALLDRLEISKCRLVGLSMGGYIGLPFALKHPGRVKCLALAHTRARADFDTERSGRTAMIEELKRDGNGNLPAKMLPRLLGPDASVEVRDYVKTTILGSSAEACIHAVTAMRDRADQTANLATLRCPTLVIAGSGDAILKVEDCEAMAAAIPGARCQVIPRTGHLSNLEAPQTFNDVLDRFLRQCDSE